MLPLKVLLFLFSLKTAFTTCICENKKNGSDSGRSQYKVTRLGKMPATINESSGITLAQPGTFWTHNDGGSNPALYRIDKNGRIVDSLLMNGIRNVDWEDIAQDKAGNLYIGDFGNNTNRRKDLTIYQVNPQKPQTINQINFKYQEQKEFPPDRKNLNFDCEAFFWHADSLYLFSKNRGNNRVKMYVLPAKAGTFTAAKLDEVYIKSQVTAADINPAGNTFALLTYGKVFLFKIAEGKSLLADPYLCIKLVKSQAEALVFINDTDFIVTNEGGKMFMVEKK